MKKKIKSNIDILDPLKNLQHQRDMMTEKINNHPLRMYHFTNSAGEDYEVDCKGFHHLIEKHMKDNGACKEDIKEAKRIREEVFQPLFKEKRLITIAINNNLKKTGRHLLDNYKEYMLEMFGMYRTVDEVVKGIRDKFGFTTSSPEVMVWKRTHSDKIKQKQTEYVLENGKDSIRVATETGRLITINKLLSYWENRMEEKPSESATKMIIAALEQARKEVKGDLITIKGQIDIKATLHASDAIDKTLAKIPVNSLIIGMVAAQRNINPTTIMAALANSQYSQLNGFNNDVTGKEEIKLPSDIIKTFDWSQIASNVKAKSQIEEKPLIDITHHQFKPDKERSEKRKREMMRAALLFMEKINIADKK